MRRSLTREQPQSSRAQMKGPLAPGEILSPSQREVDVSFRSRKLFQGGEILENGCVHQVRFL